MTYVCRTSTIRTWCQTLTATADKKNTRVYTAAAAGTNRYNRFVYINVRPPLSSMSVCVWAGQLLVSRYEACRGFYEWWATCVVDVPMNPLTRPPCVYTSKARHTVEKKHPSSTHEPTIVYNSSTTSSIAVQQKKTKAKKQGQGYSELPYLGLAEKKRGKKKENSRQGGGIGTDALSRIDH